MKTNDQQASTSSTMRDALRRAGVAAATAVLGVGAASAQMAPTQPAPAPATPVAQASSPYEATFKRVDADGDGFVTKAELEKADANLAKDFQKYDSNGDGKLSLQEFDAMLKTAKG